MKIKHQENLFILSEKGILNRSAAAITTIKAFKEDLIGVSISYKKVG